MAFGMQGEGSIVDDSTTSVVVVQDGKEHVTGILFSGQERRDPRLNIYRSTGQERKDRTKECRDMRGKENGVQHPKCL